MEVNDKLHASAALPPRIRFACTYWIGDCEERITFHCPKSKASLQPINTDATDQSSSPITMCFLQRGKKGGTLHIVTCMSDYRRGLDW
jgi:hypothetical protein